MGTITVQLTLASSDSVLVQYETVASGTPAATVVDDYTATSGFLSFAPGVVSQNFTVVIKGDDVDELDGRPEGDAQGAREAGAQLHSHGQQADCRRRRGRRLFRLRLCDRLAQE